MKLLNKERKTLMKKSTRDLIIENNVKRLRLNSHDREVYENYITYVRANLSINEHDSEKMLLNILNHLLSAEKDGMHAMEFFDHDPKQHADNMIKNMPNRTFQNIFKFIGLHILMLLGVFSFIRGFTGFFTQIEYTYLYTFLITFVTGFTMIFIFIWMIFKVVQIRIYSESNWTTTITNILISGTFVLTILAFYLPGFYLQLGPKIYTSNWAYIIIALILTPLGLYIDHHRKIDQPDTR
ncbi:DUF1129 family protein [Mammaliicoccus fleurettii]|uniref:DUF1129 family protein n=2 Tax=Staphylococcaceae TaxID=90964 RepID=UPI001FBB5CF7|nr:DUF1129 family protein [Mammaliicoccus fleurettii]